MSRSYNLLLTALFFCAWQHAFGAPTESAAPKSPKSIVCPNFVVGGTTESTAEVLKRLADKAEALLKVRVEHGAPWNEVHALVQIDVMSNMMTASTLVISRSPSDSKATEVSFDELTAHTQQSSKLVNGLIVGDAALGLTKVEDPAAVSALEGLHCEISVLAGNVPKLWERISK